jgi:hypothetical protein
MVSTWALLLSKFWLKFMLLDSFYIEKVTESSKEFYNILLAICTGAFVTPCKDLARHTSFAMKHAAKLTHHASYQYNINKTADDPEFTNTEYFTPNHFDHASSNARHSGPFVSFGLSFFRCSITKSRSSLVILSDIKGYFIITP